MVSRNTDWHWFGSLICLNTKGLAWDWFEVTTSQCIRSYSMQDATSWRCWAVLQLCNVVLSFSTNMKKGRREICRNVHLSTIKSKSEAWQKQLCIMTVHLTISSNVKFYKYTPLVTFYFKVLCHSTITGLLQMLSQK